MASLDEVGRIPTWELINPKKQAKEKKSAFLLLLCLLFHIIYIYIFVSVYISRNRSILKVQELGRARFQASLPREDPYFPRVPPWRRADQPYGNSTHHLSIAYDIFYEILHEQLT